MLFSDALTLDAPRKTKDGYMAVRARSARTGVYTYTGREIDPDNAHGLRDKAIVNVLRDDKTVFDKSAVQSFIGKPITDDHPSEAVTSSNWRDHARGTIMGALRDGEYLSFDLMLTDAAAIAKVDAGKRELSNGYGAELEFGDFTAPDGTVCDARQAKITGGNHIALVKFGRAGTECRISDAAPCASMSQDFLDTWLADERTYSPTPNPDNKSLERSDTSNPSGGGAPVRDGEHSMPKIMIVDGLQVEVTDAAEAAILKLQGQVKDERDGRAADKVTHDKALATKDAEIDDLKTRVIDQAAIDALADAKSAVIADAEKVISVKPGTKLGDTAGKSVADVRRMACAAVGIDVTDKSDDYVAARFDTLKDAKPADPLRDAINGGVRTNVIDNRAVRDLARASQY